MIPPQPLVAPAHDYPLERLRSPIHLSPPCLPTPVSCIASSSRRRSKNSSRSRRKRVESHVFDDLPWISSLDASPDLLNPWDIADLSLIPDSDSRSSPGPGPVRRRKSSLRSNPIKPSSPTVSAFPIRDTSLLSVSTSTPPPRLIPSRVLFHNLMPVSCDGRSEPPHPCIFSSTANF